MSFTNTNTSGELKEKLTSRTETGTLSTSKEYSFLKDPSVAMGIDLFHDKEMHEKIKEKLKVALSKFSTSRKTKLVHELIEKNQIVMGQFNSGTPVEIVAKERTLYKIFINPFQVQNYGGAGRAEKLRSIIIAFNENTTALKATKTLITSQQVLKIDSLNKAKDELIEQFVSEIDWLKVIDFSYFGLTQFYAYNATNKNKPEKVKVYKTTEDLLIKQLRKILSRVDSSLRPAIKTEEEEDIKNEKDMKIIKLRLAVQFFMLTYYLQMSTKSAIMILKEHKNEFVRISLDILFPDNSKNEKLKTPEVEPTPYENHKKKEKMEMVGEESNEYYEKVLKDFSKFKPVTFEDFATLLEILDILKISKTTFKTLMVQNVGEDVYYNYYTFLPKLIAVFITLNYNSDMFSTLFEIDPKLQKRLEELILNQKSQTIIKENKYI